MIERALAVVILAAGRGSRMSSALPKALHGLAGRPMIHYLLDYVAPLDPEKIVLVIGPDMPEVREAVAPHETVIQETPRGTGDAVKAALPALEGFTGDVLILYGDHPLVTTESCRRLIAAQTGGLSLFAMEPKIPGAYGRIVAGPDGTVEKIVEFADCNEEQKNITLCNGAMYCVRGDRLAGWLAQLTDDNAQGEFYLTDIVEIAAREGASCRYVLIGEEEMAAANTRAELASLERTIQARLRAAAMENGATLIDPETVYFSWDTKLGRDVIVEPNVFFGPGVEIENGVHIKAFSYLEGATIGHGTAVGPFARLRPGTLIGAGSKIGNFVEIKNATLHEGVKAGHHAYIGDAEIGAGVNYSCGAITANYDGAQKHKTIIGAQAFIGSNVTLIAPVAIGDNAYLAAGSTITKDVPAKALGIARERKQTVIDDWTKRKR
ncbi:MAG: bifunctional UDP-N-acetylglucosamine diphosphorylase/glucosamine-1-phosphate N-acetyltransferase GlmU [Alphaproteobacteria bacterium]|nr:bifunctional UDP-N-acetylglucosamine diphosphorylase/glucosamine-1-phosphate N-acetyltransferase GlmU [Alphaproteobacteria bacterium]